MRRDDPVFISCAVRPNKRLHLTDQGQRSQGPRTAELEKRAGLRHAGKVVAVHSPTFVGRR
jgi:hypothetical protein